MATRVVRERAPLTDFVARRGILRFARGGPAPRVNGPVRLRIFSPNDYNADFEGYYGAQVKEFTTPKVYVSNGTRWNLVTQSDYLTYAGSTAEIVNRLPVFDPVAHTTGTLIVVARTLEGWAFAPFFRYTTDGKNSAQLRQEAVLRGDIPASEVEV